MRDYSLFQKIKNLTITYEFHEASEGNLFSRMPSMGLIKLNRASSILIISGLSLIGLNRAYMAYMA